MFGSVSLTRVMYPKCAYGLYHLLNLIKNGVHISVGVSFNISTTFVLGKCHCWCVRESLRAHIGKFYSRLWLIRSVLRASTFSVITFIEIVIVRVYYTIPFGFNLFWNFRGITFQVLNLHCLAKDH